MTKVNLHFTGFMFGVGAPVGDLSSLQKINRLKDRGQGKAFIVLLASLAELSQYTDVSRRLQKFLAEFWPGGLTVILNCRVLPHLEKDGLVAFRVPADEQLRRRLLQDGAIVSTSVNRSGEEPLEDYGQIMERCGDWFDDDWVPSGVRKAAGTPSTVVKIDGEKLVCLREGLLDFAKVRQVWNALG